MSAPASPSAIMSTLTLGDASLPHSGSSSSSSSSSAPAPPADRVDPNAALIEQLRQEIQREKAGKRAYKAKCKTLKTSKDVLAKEARKAAIYKTRLENIQDPYRFTIPVPEIKTHAVNRKKLTDFRALCVQISKFKESDAGMQHKIDLKVGQKYKAQGVAKSGIVARNNMNEMSEYYGKLLTKIDSTILQFDQAARYRHQLAANQKKFVVQTNQARLEVLLKAEQAKAAELAKRRGAMMDLGFAILPDDLLRAGAGAAGFADDEAIEDNDAVDDGDDVIDDSDAEKGWDEEPAPDAWGDLREAGNDGPAADDDDDAEADAIAAADAISAVAAVAAADDDAEADNLDPFHADDYDPSGAADAVNDDD